MKKINWDSKVETISDFITKYGIKGASELLEKYFSDEHTFKNAAFNSHTFPNILHLGEMLEDLERALTNLSNDGAYNTGIKFGKKERSREFAKLLSDSEDD